MTTNSKKQSLSREQAGAIYDDLHRVMNSLLEKHKMSGVPPKAGAAQKKPAPKAGMAAPKLSSDEMPGLPLMLPTKPNRGHLAALGIIGLFALAKISVAVLEMSGVLAASPAQAALSSMASASATREIPSVNAAGVPFSKSELSVLTSLDHRRAELEERALRLDEREAEIAKRDREFVARQAELKELTDVIRADRDKGEKKRSAQLEQLSNVYGSMNPPEAAALIEQLDVNIALSLLERMPEKRIAQILALMNPERALSITKLLSGRTGEIR